MTSSSSPPWGTEPGELRHGGLPVQDLDWTRRSPVPTTVNIHEAKTHLSRLVARAAAGEEIVIAKAGEPLARLVAYEEQRAPRQFGRLKGKIWIAEDFDETPQWLIDAFEA